MTSKTAIGVAIVIAILIATPFAIVFTNDSGAEKEVVNDLMHVKGLEKNGVVTFKGIPYAEAPIGDLRFHAPVEKELWTETMDCTHWGNIAIQSKIHLGEEKETKEHSANESEDCLNLNIWAPADAKQGSNLPVYVWIHGGGYVEGSGQDSTYDGTVFAQEGVIVITINYRLGALGFLGLDCLKEELETGKNTTGNWGTLDQICALKWVNKYIDRFGGDKNNVTIGGESAGAFSVFNMITSPLTQDQNLFQKAILESGAIMHMMIASKSATGAQTVSLNIAKKFDPSITADNEAAKESLMEGDAFAIMDACDLNLYITANNHDRAPWPCYDGVVLPESWEKTIDNVKKGAYNNVKIIFGYNAYEGYLFTDPNVTDDQFKALVKSIFEDGTTEETAVLDYYATRTVMSVYEKTAELTAMTMFKLGVDLMQRLMSDSGATVYGFEFSHWIDSTTVPYHSIEIAFAFGQKSISGIQYDNNDIAIRDCMHAYWLNFIKTGDPNGANLSIWMTYDSDANMVMTFGKASSSMLFKAEIKALNTLRPLYFPGES